MLVERHLVLFGVCAAAVWLSGCGSRATSTAAERTARIERGRTLYAANGCAVCHGAAGRGDGPSAATLNPAPPDLRDPSRFVQGAAVEDIAATLSAGGGPGAIQMPSFSHVPEADRLALAEYVVSLRSAGP